MRIVIPGGAGFCGRLLARYFAAAGHEVIILSRRPVTIPNTTVVIWDGETLGDWAKTLDGADAVINLAGRSVNCRYNAANCAEIYASRLDSTRVIGEAIAARPNSPGVWLNASGTLSEAMATCANPPRVWLNAASATIYRHAPAEENRPMDECSGELGKGFSVDVCRRWERTLFEANLPASVRRVALRSAMVFDSEPGGVWDAFAGLAKIGLGGATAGGRQFVSWIHGEDFCRAVEWILTHDDLIGPVNLAAPNPLPNRDFLAAIRRAVGVPFGIPSARWVLEIGAWLRGTETELLLKSRRVVPTKLLASGFRFRYGNWQDAANALADAGKRK